MTTTTALPPRQNVAQSSPERTAWGVLLMAFAAFCLLCGVSSAGLYFFLVESTSPLRAEVVVGSGSVGVTGTSLIPQYESVGRALYGRESVSTAPQSLSAVLLRDPRDNQTVAEVLLRGDTLLTYMRGVRPRFAWSQTPYVIELAYLRGHMDVFVPPGAGTVVRISTPYSTVVWLDEPGEYSISGNDAQLRVMPRQGRLSLMMAQHENRAILEGQVGVLDADEGTLRVEPGLISLLAHPSLVQHHADDDTLTMQPNWDCRNGPDDDPQGVIAPLARGGRTAMHLMRGDNAVSHGDSYCVQTFGQFGMDVRPYASLALRVTFAIDDHTLSLCGQAGSECPLMLRMDYIDASGAVGQWIHGFYAKVDPSKADFPPLCSSCIQEHDRVAAGLWVTYDSGNLLTLYPPERRPASVLNVRFYASGHQYDIKVDHIDLLAALPWVDAAAEVMSDAEATPATDAPLAN